MTFIHRPPSCDAFHNHHSFYALFEGVPVQVTACLGGCERGVPWAQVFSDSVGAYVGSLVAELCPPLETINPLEGIEFINQKTEPTPA